MGKIVTVTEVWCLDCPELIGETSQENEMSLSRSGAADSTVRRKKFGRCPKCQVALKQKLDELRQSGKVKIIPPGVSGQDVVHLGQAVLKKKQEKKRYRA